MAPAPEPESALLAWLGTHQLQPPPEWPARIARFHQLLLAANADCNLTAITGYGDFLHKHIADSLLLAAACPALRTAALDLADIGCGGGFPGLPLALTFPRLRCVEIDSLAKKVALVGRFIEDLHLTGCRAVAGSARELARRPEFAGHFDLVVVRAVGDTPDLIKTCRGFLKPAGQLVAYKTPAQVEAERLLVEREAAKFHLAVSVSPIFDLPASAGQRQFWLLTRAAAVPSQS